MSQHFHALAPELKQRIKEECLRETALDTADLLGVPYPYIIPGKGKLPALYYWDSFFINLGLIRLRMIDQARHTVDNLVFLQRRLGFIPASNHKTMIMHSAPPMLAWMVRDVYRITGDKEWLRRLLPEVLHEFRFWTSKPHTTITGLYRYVSEKPGALSEDKASLLESGWMDSPRFTDVRQFNPIDLNSLLYRNAKLIHDFQAELDGKGDDRLLEKAEQIKKWLDICWEEREGFYYDYDYVKKRISDVKTLAGMSPLFVEMVDERRARRLAQQLKHFVAPGGLYVLDRPEAPLQAPWNHPLCYAPSLYMTIKGLYDYDMMEDAADIGVNWLNMVVEQYEKTGELWEWYNVQDRNAVHNGLENTPLLGWTAGVYIAIVELLGLD
jgi:alpha,alpha-trehalase